MLNVAVTNLLNVAVTNLSPVRLPCLLSHGRSQPPAVLAKAEAARVQPGRAGSPCCCQVGQSARSEPAAGARAAWAGTPGRRVARGRWQCRP